MSPIFLTKHKHACVSLSIDGRSLVIDPGAYTQDASRLLADADAVLVTHSHFDHVDMEALRAALDHRPTLVLLAPADVVEQFADTAAAAAGNVIVARGGEDLDLIGVRVVVVASAHASIHTGIDVPENVGYVIGDRVYHPGDAYVVPPLTVHTVLVPVSGPWVKIGEAIDFIAAAEPAQTVAIHDVMLSDVGLESAARFLGEHGLTGRPMLMLGTGESTRIDA